MWQMKPQTCCMSCCRFPEGFQHFLSLKQLRHFNTRALQGLARLRPLQPWVRLCPRQLSAPLTLPDDSLVRIAPAVWVWWPHDVTYCQGLQAALTCAWQHCQQKSDIASYRAPSASPKWPCRKKWWLSWRLKDKTATNWLESSIDPGIHRRGFHCGFRQEESGHGPKTNLLRLSLLSQGGFPKFGVPYLSAL